MRLLVLTPEYLEKQAGGISTFYRNLLPVLAANGHDIRVIVGSGVTAVTNPTAMNLDGVEVEHLDLALLHKYHARFARYCSIPVLRRHLAAAWAIREQAGNGERYDAVEAADWGLSFLPWLIQGGPPVVAQLHGSLGQIDSADPIAGEEVASTLIRMLESAGVNRARGAQAPSLAAAKFWELQTGRRVDAIAPAWRPSHEEPAVQRRSERGLVVGRVQRWKGPDVLCEALRLLGKDAPGIDWIGRDTPYGTRARSTATHLQETYPDVWGKVVIPKAQQPQSVVAQLQRRAAFVLVPSLWDVFNYTCVESMGAGTPVICSTGAGASELVEDGVNGYLFEKGNAASLAGVLERLLSLGPQRREELGEAGRQTVLRLLDPQRIAEERICAYERATRGGPQAAPPPDDWLRDACAPAGPGQDSMAFLDHLPLKPLVTYVLRRAGAKLTG